jgi:hypothetical protein
MTAIEATKVAIRELVGPALRAEGFKGSGSTWNLSSESGDFAVVNVQRSQYNQGSEVRFVVNLAIVPKPWMENRHPEDLGVRPVKEYYGLWRDRLHPSPSSTHSTEGADRWWLVRDSQSADAAATDVVEQLRLTAVPKLRSLLDREILVAELRKGDLGFIKGKGNWAFRCSGLAILLSDDGPSQELEDVLDELGALLNDQQMDMYRNLCAWVERRTSG